MTDPTVPLDLIFQILINLRVKTLCRFRCVSKSWDALISDPIFHQCHHNRSKNNPLFLRVSSHCDTPGCKKLHFVVLDKEKNLITEFATTKPPYLSPFFSTCVDLVCMNDSSKVYLLNPATQERIALPQNKFQHSKCYYLWSAYVAWLPSSNEYKVLSIFQRFRHAKKEIPACHCEVLSLASTGPVTNDSNWKTVGNPPSISQRRWYAGTSVNGSVYLLSDCDVESYNDGIARFDLEREEWSVLSPPAPKYILQIGTFVLDRGGCVLCVVGYCRGSRLNLWFLNDCNWVKKYTIRMPDLRKAMLALPLAVEEDGRLLMEVYFMDRHRHNFISELQHYDPKRRRSTEISTVGKKGREYYSTCGFYVESFMPLGTR